MSTKIGSLEDGDPLADWARHITGRCACNSGRRACDQRAAAALSAARAAVVREELAKEPVGPYGVEHHRPQRRNPMFHGDTNTAGGWVVIGPIVEVEQVWASRHAAIAVANALNLTAPRPAEGEE